MNVYKIDYWDGGRCWDEDLYVVAIADSEEEAIEKSSAALNSSDKDRYLKNKKYIIEDLGPVETFSHAVIFQDYRDR